MIKNVCVIFVLLLFLLCARDAPCTQEQRGKEFKILAFSGGGVRGVVSLKILKFLSESSSLPPIRWRDEFDCFAGTSTGAIIAVGLAMGIPVDELQEMYCAMSAKVFENPRNFAIMYPEYYRDHLREGLIQMLRWRFSSPEEACLNDLLPNRVVIVTVNLENPDTHRWQMDVKGNFLKKEGKIKIIDALLETTAAPFFFSSYEHHIDGGTVAKDPSMVAFSRAYRPCNLDRDGVFMLSIGTGFLARYIHGDEKWGKVQWLSPFAWNSSAGSMPILKMLLDLEEERPSQLLSRMFPENFRKLDVKLLKKVALDDVAGIPALIKRCDEVFSDPSQRDFWQGARKWLRDHIHGKEADHTALMMKK